MSANDLPGTLETKHNPVCANASFQSTAAQETEAVPESVPGLDPRGYALTERLGGGGMGDVYRAVDPALGRDLAVKVMKAELRGHVAAEGRFLREARITGSLQHPGIVPIHNLGRLADGRLHYTMRLVRGRTLAAILHDEAGQAQHWPALLTIFEKVCQAVAYAHSKHVIHRDLKPANVMAGRFGEVQVMDWGLAKLLTAADEPTAMEGQDEPAGTRIYTEEADAPTEQTRMGREMGTPAYMPPEQALGEWDAVDERADVFALGAILCEILTGQTPYGIRDGGEALRKAKRGEIAEALTRLASCGADAALAALCRECLTPAREGRPRNAEQVAQRVAAYQAEVQERLRRAELERATAVVKATGERKKRRWMWTAVVLLLAGAAVSTLLAAWALKAEGKAQTRLSQMEKANEVLTSIFHDLDPRAEEKGGPSLRRQLSKHLERAAAQLDEASLGDAAAVARLQTQLGESLINLGQAQLAIEVLRKAERTLESQLGPDHPDSLLARNHLANAYGNSGLLMEAVRLHERNLPLYEATLGADHPGTLTSRHSLASTYRDAGRIADAIRLHEQNLKLRESKLGSDDPDTLLSRNELASAYWSDSRFEEAIRLYEQTLKQRESKLGPDHLDTLNTRANLATAYLDADRIEESIQLHEQNLKKLEAKLGDDHPETLTSRSNLAVAYLSAGRKAAAIQLHERTLKMREAKLGTDHPDTLISRVNLAEAYGAANRTGESIRLYEQTVKQMETKIGTDHPDTLKSRNNLAEAYRLEGRLHDAIRLHEQTLKQREAKLGKNHSDTLISRDSLAEAYRESGRIAEAIKLHEQTLKQREAKLGNEHVDTLVSRNNLAQAYHDADRTGEAIRLFEQTLKMREAKLGADHLDTLMCSSNLAEAYRDAGRTAEAVRLHEQTLKMREAKLGTDHPQTLASRNDLAAAYWSDGQLERAIPLCEKTLRQRKAKPGPDHPDTLLTMANLGAIYRDSGRLQEAIPLLETALQRGRQRAGGLPAQLAWVSDALAKAYEMAGQLAKAETIFRQRLEQAQRQYGSEDLRTVGFLVPLGMNLLRQKKYAEAEPLLRQCLTLRELTQPDEWSTFNARSGLGEALLGQKKYAEAEPLLVQSYEAMKQRQDKIPPIFRPSRLREALERLVRLYEATDQKEKAADWRKKLQEVNTVAKPIQP